MFWIVDTVRTSRGHDAVTEELGFDELGQTRDRDGTLRNEDDAVVEPAEWHGFGRFGARRKCGDERDVTPSRGCRTNPGGAR